MFEVQYFSILMHSHDSCQTSRSTTTTTSGISTQVPSSMAAPDILVTNEQNNDGDPIGGDVSLFHLIDYRLLIVLIYMYNISVPPDAEKEQ